MAIQIPNPGTGNGASGDNEFVLWSKVKDNFSNTTHAASRLVGEETGNVMEVGAYGLGGVSTASTTIDESTIGPMRNSFCSISRSIGGGEQLPNAGYNFSGILRKTSQGGTVLALPYPHPTSINRMGFHFVSFDASNGSLVQVATIYTDKNTTKDTATGFLKASSPVLHVYNDKIDKIHEAEQLDITVDKKGVGHYEIHGTTGLRKNDGWFMSPPRDVHGNVLCMVDLEEKDGVITLKTYKKKFDFETVSIVHDYDNPLDIPDGVCVEFRFNDLPLDDVQDEELDLDKE